MQRPYLYSRCVHITDCAKTTRTNIYEEFFILHNPIGHQFLVREELLSSSSDLTPSSERWAVPTFCALVVTAIVTLEGMLPTSRKHVLTAVDTFAVVMIVKFLQGWRLIRKICPLATRRPSISPWFRVCVFTCYSIATLV